MANPATPGEAIAGRLLDPAATILAALVAGRVYPSKPTQEPTGDYVIYYRAGGGDGANLSGASRLKAHEMRVEATGTTETGAEAVLDAAVALLDGWQDRSIGVQGCFGVGDRDESVLEDGRQVSGQTFRLWFKAQ